MKKNGYPETTIKATMEYHKTKDLLHAKTLLGHKDTIKPDETANPMEVGKIVHRGFSELVIPDIVALWKKRYRCRSLIGLKNQKRN
jgi:hypothetical protein